MRNTFKILLSFIIFTTYLFSSINTVVSADDELQRHKSSFPNNILSSDYYNQEADYNLWEKFLTYDLCITDYNSLTDEQKELCKFIFETERSASGTVRCERARKILAGEDIGDRITVSEIKNGTKISSEGSYYAYDYQESDNSFYICKYIAPDIIHLDNEAIAEYWLDDKGTEKILEHKGLYAHFTASEEFSELAEKLSENEKSKYLGKNVLYIDDTYISFLNDGNVLSCTFLGADRKKNAETILQDNILYAVLPDDTAVIVSNKFKSTRLYKEEIVIPEEIDGHTVVAVESGAFNSANITQIVLPETIKYIGAKAFEECKYLDSINFPATLEMIGTAAFKDCAYLESIEINCPDLVIKSHAFSDSGLKQFSVSAKKLDEFSFAYCSAEDVVIGDNTEGIEAYAFYCCDSLESVTLPENLKYIANGAFSKTGLSRIDIPSETEILGKLPAATGGVDGTFTNPTDPLTDPSEPVIDSDKTICGVAGSCAENYANDNNIKFISNDLIRLSKEKLTIESGSEKDLRLINCDSQVQWDSSDENTVTVENGKVMGISAGSAVITASIGEQAFKCEVTVTEPLEKRETLLGDANMDYQINVRDCAFIALKLAENDTEKLTIYADYNNDNKVNVRDAAAIANYLAKNIK